MVAQIELPVAQDMELRKPSTMDLLQVALQNNAAIDVIERWRRCNLTSGNWTPKLASTKN
jgi:hypothetical protein